jgi:hypothetical protein
MTYLSQNLYVWRCPCDWKKYEENSGKRKREIITLINYIDSNFAENSWITNLNHIYHSIKHKKCKGVGWLIHYPHKLLELPKPLATWMKWHPQHIQINIFIFYGTKKQCNFNMHSNYKHSCNIFNMRHTIQ